MRLASIALFLCIVCTVSCVPTSKITYLQESKSTMADSLMVARRLQQPYRLQVNDVINITIAQSADPILNSVFSNETGESVSGAGLTGYSIDTRGFIRLPELGNVKAIGLTTEELQEKITNIMLEKYLKEEDEVFLTVKLAGISYTMVGEVSGTGQKSVLKEQINIVEAIAEGGGVPSTGDLTAVKIVRTYPDGQVRVHVVDVTNIDVVYSPYYYIQPNDMIVVDPLPQKSLGVGTTGFSALTTVLSVLTTLVTTILIFSR